MNSRLPIGRRWYAALLPLIAAAALFTGALIAMAQQTPQESSDGQGQSVLVEETSAETLTVTAVTATAFSTTVEVTADLDAPLSADETFAVAAEQTTLTFAGSDEQFLPVSLDYAIADSRDRVIVAAEYDTPPLSEALTIAVGELVVLPPDADGQIVARDLEASAEVDPESIGSPASVAEYEETTIDTGFGWSYVIEAIEYDDSAIRVRYRVEGDVSDLRPLPPVGEGDRVVIPFPDTTEGSTEISLPRANASTLVFGPAARAVESPVEVVVRQDAADRWSAGAVPEDIEEVAVTTDVTADHEVVSVHIVSRTGYVGSGSPGTYATLHDDAGREYSLYHASGSFPATYAQWDFIGPLDEDVSELRLLIPGHTTVEESGPEVQLDLP